MSWVRTHKHMLKNLSLQVLTLYSELDIQTTAFACASGIRCPSGCATCCGSENVEATVLEMLPMAFHLFATCQAELLIKRLEIITNSRQCILFRKDHLADGKWGCSQYSHRPLICRLFGFSGIRDRDGNPKFALCRYMQGRVNMEEAHMQSALADMPVFSDAGMKITSLHPSLGTDRIPVNEALSAALYKVGMYVSYTESNTADGMENPELPPDKPVSPITPAPKKVA